MNRKDHIVCALFLVSMALNLAGCEPITPEDKAFFDEQHRLRGEKVSAMRAASVVVTMEEAIEHVRNYPAHEGDQTMEGWVISQFSGEGGQIFFPVWKALRRGSNILEVNYEFMYFENEGQVKRYSFSWALDTLDMTVDEPVMEIVEENAMPDEVMKNLHKRRVQQHEQELR